jgi:chemotaxis family two-component system response regulator Rcp1
MSPNRLARGRPAEILLAEDNENDVELTKLAFRHSRLAVHLHHVPNGEECMAFLRKEGKYADATTPDLVLLDLNMPRMDGREVLHEVVHDERLRHLPIVVMTSSDAERDVLAAYQLRCSSYIVKPVDFESFVKLIQLLSDYWFTVVKLPTRLPCEDDLTVQ